MDEQAEYQVDLRQVFKLLFKKLPIIIAVVLVFGLAAFIYSNFFATPIYSASVRFYVNNQQGLSDSTKVQGSDITTARMLVNSYTNLIDSDLVMDEVANASALGYTADQIKRMISAQAVDEDAPMFVVMVVNPNPEYAQLIANTIADVAPALIQGVVKGSEAEAYDRAKLPELPVSPNVRRSTVLGVLLGLILGVAFVLIFEALDTRIKNSDFLVQRFELPVLGIIPTIAFEAGKKTTEAGKEGAR